MHFSLFFFHHFNSRFRMFLLLSSVDKTTFFWGENFLLGCCLVMGLVELFRLLYCVSGHSTPTSSSLSQLLRHVNSKQRKNGTMVRRACVKNRSFLFLLQNKYQVRKDITHKIAYLHMSIGSPYLAPRITSGARQNRDWMQVQTRWFSQQLEPKSITCKENR